MSTVTHLTIAEYDRMIAAGAFDPREQNRLELIYGELREEIELCPASLWQTS
jgi:hypothetical protein